MKRHARHQSRRPSHVLGSLAAAAALSIVQVAMAQIGPAHAADYDVEIVTEGLVHPWAIGFIPDSRLMLVTERPGNLHVVDRDSGETRQISGTPDVHARGQGGLLDIALHPAFPEEDWLYMTWAGANAEGLSTTYMGRARLDLDDHSLSDLEILYVAEPYLDSNAHYGSRIVFDHDGYLYFSTGDRNSKDFGPQHYSQDRSNDLGAILRLNADGSIPQDNPFVDDPDARAAIFSYGHRNPQGMAVHPQTGELWQNEHGENNGDEINVIQAGGNFGWPIATWGVDYRTGERFAPTPPEVPETIDPVYYWGPDHPEGFPPSGMAFYFGEAFPEWEGSILMGNLAHRYLGRFSVEGHHVEQVDRLLDGQGWRIRDVAVAPDDGFIYVIADAESAPIARIRPSQ